MNVKPTTRATYQEIVHRAVARVVEGLDAPLDLAVLAKEAALAPLHFHHVFRGMLGETALELHRRLRLERAAHALLHPDAAVTEVGLAAGYETHAAFTRTFRRAFGVSPTEFRKDTRVRRFTLAARSGVHFSPVPGPLLVHFAQGGTTMDVQFETFPARRVATLRHVGPYHRIGETFARLGAFAGPAGLFGRPGVEMVALYHDDPEGVAPEALQSDAGLVLPDGVPVPAGLTEVTLPAGRYAKVVHRGAYAHLGDAWGRFLGEWLPASGERLADGPSFEVYRNTPMTAAEADLETDLYAPLA